MQEAVHISEQGHQDGEDGQEQAGGKHWGLQWVRVQQEQKQVESIHLTTVEPHPLF